jgi:hypothetical protein
MRPNVMMIDGGMDSLAALDIIVSANNVTPTPTTQTSAADAATAVRKLQSNQTLTDAEKKILGISVTPAKTVPQAAVPIVTDAQKDAAMGVSRPPITVAPVVDELAKKNAATQAAADLKAKQEADAKVAADKATADAKALEDKVIADDKAAEIAKAEALAAVEATNAAIKAANAPVEKGDPTKTAYADLTPAQRAAMSYQEKLDYLAAERNFRMANEATQRAESDPMFNFAVRPEAPQVPGMIQYYSWIGGRTTGQWKLYAAVDNAANRATYGARIFGGKTQATADSITGANTLVNRPIWDPNTQTWSSTGTSTSTTASTSTTTSSTTSTSTSTTGYVTTNGVLNFNGVPFTGKYNGSDYVNGVIKQVVGSDVDYSTVNGVLNYKGAPYTGDYQGKKYINGKVVSSQGTGLNYSGSGTSLDPFMENGEPFTGSKFGSTYKNGVIVDMVQKTADDIAKQGRLDARTEFGNTLKALGLPQDLIDEIDTMIKQDYTNSQMYLELQKTQAWKNRFPGMAALSAAGKAIDAGTYISQEKSMLQTLDYYGIDKNIFGTTAELGKQIGNLVSPKRFETVVALAAQDVEQNPDVLAALNLYYGVDKSAAIAYILNPTIGLDIIQRQARAAEIGAKAAKSKFDFGTTEGKAGYGVAESFINAAGTMDLQALDVTFQQARGLSDVQSSIAATEGAKYNDLSAVSAILGKDQAAILDSQRRAARSVARFSGSSGLGSGSLATQSSI